MDISFSGQAFVFLAMVMCGVLCGIIFDVFRAVRHARRTASGIVAMQDLLFWLVELAAIYTVAFKLNYAYVRAFEGIALVIGSWIYFMTLSKYALRFLCRAVDMIIKTARFIFAPIAKAFLTFAGFVRKLRAFAGGRLASFAALIKRKVRALWNRICPAKTVDRLKSIFKIRKKLKKT